MILTRAFTSNTNINFPEAGYIVKSIYFDYFEKEANVVVYGFADVATAELVLGGQAIEPIDKLAFSYAGVEFDFDDIKSEIETKLQAEVIFQ